MLEMFCPLAKDNCKTNCIFFNEKKEGKEQCQLFQAVKAINMYVYNIDSIDSSVTDVCSKLDDINRTVRNLRK